MSLTYWSLPFPLSPPSPIFIHISNDINSISYWVLSSSLLKSISSTYSHSSSSQFPIPAPLSAYLPPSQCTLPLLIAVSLTYLCQSLPQLNLALSLISIPTFSISPCPLSTAVPFPHTKLSVPTTFASTLYAPQSSTFSHPIYSSTVWASPPSPSSSYHTSSSVSIGGPHFLRSLLSIQLYAISTLSYLSSFFLPPTPIPLADKSKGVLTFLTSFPI